MIEYMVYYRRGEAVSTDFFEADRCMFSEGFVIFLDEGEAPVRIYSSVAFISAQPVN